MNFLITFYASEWVIIILYGFYLQVRKSPAKRNLYGHIAVFYLIPKSRTITILTLHNQLHMKAEKYVLYILKGCANDMVFCFTVKKIDSQMHL